MRRIQTTLHRKLIIEHFRLHQIVYKPCITLSAQIRGQSGSLSLFSVRNSICCERIDGLCFSQVGPSTCLPCPSETERLSTRSLHRQNAAKCGQSETRKVRRWLSRGTSEWRYVDYSTVQSCIARMFSLDESFKYQNAILEWDYWL